MLTELAGMGKSKNSAAKAALGSRKRELQNRAKAASANRPKASDFFNDAVDDFHESRNQKKIMLSAQDDAGDDDEFQTSSVLALDDDFDDGFNDYEAGDDDEDDDGDDDGGDEEGDDDEAGDGNDDDDEEEGAAIFRSLSFEFAYSCCWSPLSLRRRQTLRPRPTGRGMKSA